MPTVYPLAPLGINDQVTIEAAFDIVRFVPGAPVLFLFMEHHNTPATFTQNIAAGEELVAHASVTLLGAGKPRMGVFQPSQRASRIL